MVWCIPCRSAWNSSCNAGWSLTSSWNGCESDFCTRRLVVPEDPSRFSLAFSASCPAATMLARVMEAPRTGSRWETGRTPNWAGLPRPDLSNARGSCSINEWSCRWTYQSLMYIWQFHYNLFSGMVFMTCSCSHACSAFVRMCANGLCHFFMRLLQN